MPLHAILDQLKGLPPALVQIPEMEVQRDEGDACARKLDAAGVPVIAVRCKGMIHDFDLLYVLDQVVGTRGAVGQADQEIKQHLNKRCNPHRGGLVAPVGIFRISIGFCAPTPAPAFRHSLSFEDDYHDRAFPRNRGAPQLSPMSAPTIYKYPRLHPALLYGGWREIQSPLQTAFQLHLFSCSCIYFQLSQLPPTSAGPDAEWCGCRKGRCGQWVSGAPLATD
ncbi:alpha/beta hydrolase family protein [Pseudomonas helmanticensis]|uniref:Alpha/beta hydrolase family protein n=1 Tax=Pseudomonas helmanticensis TaxID=1471381 RepID=A0A4R7VE82_9PSED|nr:alpha/beta hydrolase family protein [Pseudomonas helmanticensis]